MGKFGELFVSESGAKLIIRGSEETHLSPEKRFCATDELIIAITFEHFQAGEDEWVVAALCPISINNK